MVLPFLVISLVAAASLNTFVAPDMASPSGSCPSSSRRRGRF